MSLALFTTHMREGRPQAALRAASEACHAAPAEPQPHYAYGEAWLALDEPARAEQAFAAAIKLNPSWADAWVNLGLSRYRQGGIENAKAAMRQALRYAPAHSAALGNLGAFLRITGELEASETLLKRCIANDPRNAGARLNLAADLLIDERSADALALLDAAPEVPGDAGVLRHWLLCRSLALLQLGRPAEARAALDALAALGPLPLALAPLWHWRLVLLAMAEDDSDEASRQAGLMELSLANGAPQAVIEHRIMAHYALAKFRSLQGDAAGAFAHWRAGHELLKPSQPFSRENHAACVDANIAAFPAGRFSRGRTARNADPAPVFIVGMPRSGTTLCEQILAAHRHVHGAGERDALRATFARLGGVADAALGVHRISAMHTDALDAAADGYLAELHALAPGKARIVDKLPANYLNLGLVGLMLPGARIIHCVRDPRDIGLSIFTFRFYGLHGYAHDLADLGWAIAQQERLMAHWRQALPNAILTVKLSDWVTDFDATLARVLAHLDLPHDPNCARFHERDSVVRTASRAQVRRPINADGLGRWNHYEHQLQPLIAELNAAGALDVWTATIPSVLPSSSNIGCSP